MVLTILGFLSIRRLKFHELIIFLVLKLTLHFFYGMKENINCYTIDTQISPLPIANLFMYKTFIKVIQ